MTIKVSPAALNAYAYVMTAMSEAAYFMEAYRKEWSTFGFAQHGIMGYAEVSHGRFAHDVQDAIASIREVLVRSGAELQQAEEFYLKTDNAAAERLDGTYPDVRRPSLADDKKPVDR